MSTISPLLSRTSNLMSSELLRRRLQETQRDLLLAQDQASTGKKLSRGSDAPGSISAMLHLNQSKILREQQQINLEHARGVLDLGDAALRDITDILIEAQQIASSQIGIGSDAVTRATQAGVIDAQLAGAIEAANRQFNGLAVFGGNNGAGDGNPVFTSFLGGIRYTGGDTSLNNDGGALSNLDFNSNGIDALGALSSRVKTLIDLDPRADGQVRLRDIDGARERGFSAGAIGLTVNGVPTTVDLTNADTLDDVVTRVNESIASLSPGAGSIALTPGGYTLTANAGNTITIVDAAGGTTAQDLGLDLTATASTVAGADLNVKLTERTQLSSFGASVDFASGLLINQGENTAVADFSAATTVQDMQNVIDALNLGLRLSINEAGTGLDLVSEVSGIELSIGENGGTTAEDLGLRTLGQSTLLSDFRGGVGVQTTPAGDADLDITLHDGTNFTVDLASASTVSDVIALTQAAATTAGLTLGTDFQIALAATGNGFEITDNTIGGGDFIVTNAGLSFAAENLGIKSNAGAASTIAGEDQSKLSVENLFTHLQELSTALRNNDEAGISLAGSSVEDDIDLVVSARAEVGVKARRVQDQLVLIQDRDIQEQTMLSQLQDADLTEVLTRFQQLQLQLQASLQVGSANQQLSLLDFLR
ncbi:MAG: flagellin [Phycisphaeraceae bacterium]